MKGQATMVRKIVDEKHDLWRVINIQTNNTELEFKEPVVLLSSGQLKDSELSQQEPEKPTEPLESSAETELKEESTDPAGATHTK